MEIKFPYQLSKSLLKGTIMSHKYSKMKYKKVLFIYD